MFFFTKRISISTGCKGVERQNAFMIMKSGDKALLNTHQPLLNLMELQTVTICFNRNLTIEATLVGPIVFKGEIYVACPFNTAWKIYWKSALPSSITGFSHCLDRSDKIAGPGGSHPLLMWLPACALGALSVAEVREKLSWLEFSHF